MIKADIIKKVAQELEMNDKESLAVVDGILDSLKDVICEHRRLEIRDFGVFQIKTRKERIGRNPRDKMEYPIPARQVVTFKIGKELKLQAQGKAAGDA
jgi:nucleoid DNA-binding protein